VRNPCQAGHHHASGYASSATNPRAVTSLKSFLYRYFADEAGKFMTYLDSYDIGHRDFTACLGIRHAQDLGTPDCRLVWGLKSDFGSIRKKPVNDILVQCARCFSRWLPPESSLEL
jgi:hypothetical protein